MRSYTIEWKRLITEGGVIVVSILLAFAIDAWWHERQQGNDANDPAAEVPPPEQQGEEDECRTFYSYNSWLWS